MSAGPLRRLLGAIGLMALVPICLRLVDGSIDATQAATRAVITLMAVMVIGRVVSSWLHTVAGTYEDVRAELVDEGPSQHLGGNPVVSGPPADGQSGSEPADK